MAVTMTVDINDFVEDIINSTSVRVSDSSFKDVPFEVVHVK